MVLISGEAIDGSARRYIGEINFSGHENEHRGEGEGQDAQEVLHRPLYAIEVGPRL
jgi:hypothetical protein